jgi:hypothetical protein
MLARLTTVDKEYVKLHEFQSQAETDVGNPNEWGLICGWHAAVIF